MRVRDQGVQRLLQSVKGDVRKLKSGLAVAVNATARQSIGIWAKAITKKIAVTQKAVRETIKVVKKAEAGERWISSTVTQRKERNRIPLKEFRPKQTSAGVSYKISRYGGKGFLPSGFIVQSLGGHVFKRDGPKIKMTKGRYAGTKTLRQRIFKQYGPSPWGVTVKNNLKPEIQADSMVYLIKQIDRRIRAINGGWIRNDNVRTVR
jgi:hypothetical protein